MLTAVLNASLLQNNFFIIIFFKKKNTGCEYWKETHAGWNEEKNVATVVSSCGIFLGNFGI